MRRAAAAVLAAAAIIVTTMSLAIAQSSAQAPTRTTPAVVDQPRPFGYVLGDLVTQRVLLQAEGLDVEPAALPTAQRVNVWFERRAPRIEADSGERRWLVVEYQLINAPQALTTVNLPAWTLEPISGGANLSIAAWPISVAPLTPRLSFDTGGLGELRDDRAAPLIQTAPLRRQTVIWSTALAIVLAGWLAWLQWRNRQEILNQPFARALRTIRGMDETAPEAWQALHRAFDRTAGRVMQVESLPALFQRAPQLQPLRPQIERFFVQSNQRFYGARLPGDPVSVRALCSELRRVEKRYAR